MLQSGTHTGETNTPSLCHLSGSDPGHERCGDSTFRTGTIYSGTFGSISPSSQVLRGARSTHGGLTPLQTWPLISMFLQRRAGLLGSSSQLVSSVGLPAAAQVQSGTREARICNTLFVLQEENRLMRGQIVPNWERTFSAPAVAL